MKKIIYTYLFFFLSISAIFAQDRYIDEMFDVEITRGVKYASNISILTGAPTSIDLVMDIYSPADDTETDRAVVLIAPTGSFLPILFNGTTTGSLQDSASVEMAMRLTKRGYVVAIYDYRKGWLPTSPDADVRKGTLLQAAYRGIQDTRTAVRFLRKTIADDSNPWGISSNNIGVWGIGTGGYLSLGAGSLDDISEVTLDKFLDINGDPLIVEALNGNIDGTNTTPLNTPNHVGFSSDFTFSFNAGGALGDANWFDGADNEPAYVGVHCPQDVFAPYYNGFVIVPTTNEIVVQVAGTRLAIETANSLGSNDGISGISAEDDPIRALITEQEATTITAQIPQQQPVQIQLGVNNFYGFNIPITQGPQGSPWSWTGLDDLTNLVALTNGALGTNFDADALNMSSLQTNPDMSAEKGRRYIDTIFMLAIPRMYVAMELGDAVTGTEDIIAASNVGLQLAPNPAVEQVVFTSNADAPITHLQIYDMKGLLISHKSGINSDSYTLYRNNLPDGIYIAKLYFEAGAVTKKIIFN